MKRKKKKKKKKKMKRRRKKKTTVDPERGTTFHAVRSARKGNLFAPYRRSEPAVEEKASSAEGQLVSGWKFTVNGAALAPDEGWIGNDGHSDVEKGGGKADPLLSPPPPTPNASPVRWNLLLFAEPP
jgi:hypothetical protein